MDNQELIRVIVKELENTEMMKKLDENIEKLNKLIIGNGDKGLCEQVRTLQIIVKPLWAIIGVLGTAIIGGLIKIFLGG